MCIYSHIKKSHGCSNAQVVIKFPHSIITGFMDQTFAVTTATLCIKMAILPAHFSRGGGVNSDGEWTQLISLASFKVPSGLTALPLCPEMLR